MISILLSMQAELYVPFSSAYLSHVPWAFLVPDSYGISLIQSVMLSDVVAPFVLPPSGHWVLFNSATGLK